ncbi:related to glucan-beta-glucosidase precursor [Lichtheimia corymbifera JMRC:FSU:9682]|uniref:Related to glucan-beta-glucosidase n=1 Tax=Lichtheimia corymbifera JMRC:FSU:9682 TaxID=1263082 RepID=A0A068S7G1_9FUNG|nr:related to glucan-beta-glucosidase precursor [Lichtheimia corymbifera JMRC:FSU:9682]
MAEKVKSLFKKVEHLGQPPPLPKSQNIPPAPQFPPYDAVTAEMYRHRKQVGVNLGSLFCLEGWLAPAQLKSCGLQHDWESESDYLDACQSRESARGALEDHWKTFVTEKDFEFLASAGINSVRVPIGYWVAADHEDMVGPFKKYQGVYDAAWNYLLQLIANASKYQIGVLIDLHAAPGAQNCDSHCGVSSGQAQLFKFASHNASIAIKVLTRLAKTLAPVNNVIGLELLNEPKDDSSLGSFYTDAAKAIRQATGDIRLPIYIGDAWNVNKYSEWIAGHQNQIDFCVLDTHQYFCHMPADHAKTAEQHTKHLTTGLKQKLGDNSRRIRGNMVVGEWSVVLNNKSIPQGQHDGQVMRDFGQAELSRMMVGTGALFTALRMASYLATWVALLNYNRMLNPRLRLKKDNLLQGAYNQHAQYWANEKNQAIIDNTWRFQKGFDAGYEIALRFFKERSRIGFTGQLAHEYAIQNSHEGDNGVAQAWQFEHGFVQGVQAAEHAIAQ